MHPIRSALIATALLLVPVASLAAPAPQVSVDGSNLMTAFWFANNYTDVELLVCGSVPHTSGCFGSGSLGPFGKVGALIVGTAVADPVAHTITQDIYAVEQAYNGAPITKLYVYRLVETIDATNGRADVTVARVKTVPLPLKGGLGAKTFLASNGHALYIATDQDPHAITVEKHGFAIAQVYTLAPGSNVSSLTANEDGCVGVTSGQSGGSDGNILLCSNGNGGLESVGTNFVVGSTNGVSSAYVITEEGSAASRVHVVRNPDPKH